MTRLLIAFMRGLSWFPYPLQAMFGALLGGLLYWLIGSRRRVALRNLELCFPSWTPQRRAAVARAHFRAFARTFLDRGLLWFASAKRLKKLIHVEGIEHLEAALPEHSGRPLIILVPHFLGLDAGGMIVAMRRKSVTMYTRQRNAVLDAQLRAGRQRFSGSELYARSDGIRPVIRAMKKGLPYFILPDMDLGAGDALFIDFFGIATATVTAVPRLAASTGAQVVPMVATLAPNRRGYQVKFFPAWTDYPAQRSSDGTIDYEAATRQMNQFIETRVRETPEQYYWVHKRFKTRPPGAASLYAK